MFIWIACPDGYKIGNGLGYCPGTGDCCIAGWTAGCGEGCMKGRCEELGGTWIAKDYSLNPYTCEMGGKNYAVVNNPKMYMIHLWHIFSTRILYLYSFFYSSVIFGVDEKERCVRRSYYDPIIAFNKLAPIRTTISKLHYLTMWKIF